MKKRKPAPRWWWVEGYNQCGCSSEANRKKDLLGYCGTHGGPRDYVYKLPWLRKGSAKP